jgi:hypothetical protein
MMKQQRAIMITCLLLLLASQTLISCTPGHLGSNVIAFVRDGQLWTIDPNGANAFAIVTQDSPVIGYNWSPDHRLIAFRALDTSYARSAAAKKLASHPITGLLEDTPSTINTVGVDGGMPMTIAFSSPDVRYSNVIWHASGTRLMYRQTSELTPPQPDKARWWISQNDQPGQIAARTLPASYSIPSFAEGQTKAVGNSEHGVFSITLKETSVRYLVGEPLPGHPLPASLERILWQPAHENASILYAVPATPQQRPATKPFNVQLIQRTMDGRTTNLATCACTQFAWSPDGKAVLYSTGSSYTVLNIENKASFEIKGEENSAPYWSPDSQFLLLDGLHTLILAQISHKRQTLLLSDGKTLPASGTATLPLPAANILLQPAPNNPWAADSRHFLFLTRDRLLWQGQALHAGKGLYTVTIDDSGQPQYKPAAVVAGDVTQASWRYQDANTTFLHH